MLPADWQAAKPTALFKNNNNKTTQKTNNIVHSSLLVELEVGQRHVKDVKKSEAAFQVVYICGKIERKRKM